MTIAEALERHRTFRLGWSWDLAYYNQWCWAATHGDHIITVRPIADYATEGPSVWKTNYLAPIRYAILPIYYFSPRPETLLVIHAVVFWWMLPAAYLLVRSETESIAAGLAAVFFVWLTPLLVPLAANDFRELQLALPFMIWAVHGVRARSAAWTLLGVFGVLACRQEYALFVASLALIAPKRKEGIVRRDRWARALWYGGLAWLLVVFFGFLVIVSGWGTPAAYLQQFLGPKPGFLETPVTAVQIWAVGLGGWALIGFAAPRALLIMVPWLWSVSSGRFALRLLGTTAWHHVRYAAPFAGAGIIAGLLGGARLWRFAARFPSPWAWRAAGATLVFAALAVAHIVVRDRSSQVPYDIGPAEAASLRSWIDRVGPDAGVVAHYDLTAPLSSRRELYSYVMKQNEPRGYPDALSESITWVFLRYPDMEPEALLSQGFVEVYAGPTTRVFARPEALPARGP